MRKPTLLSQILNLFLSVDESHTHALSKDTKHSRLDGQVCFCRWLFSDAVKPRGYISWPVWWPLRGFNKTAWGAKLILTGDLASPVSCASLDHLLMAQHCHMCFSACFSPPTAPHPPPIDSISDITTVEKPYLKNQGHSNSL